MTIVERELGDSESMSANCDVTPIGIVSLPSAIDKPLNRSSALRLLHPPGWVLCGYLRVDARTLRVESCSP